MQIENLLTLFMPTKQTDTGHINLSSSKKLFTRLIHTVYAAATKSDDMEIFLRAKSSPKTGLQDKRKAWNCKEIQENHPDEYIK